MLTPHKSDWMREVPYFSIGLPEMLPRERRADLVENNIRFTVTSRYSIYIHPSL